MQPAGEPRLDDEPQGVAAASLRSPAARNAREATPGDVADDRGDVLPPTPPGGTRLLEWLRRSGRGLAALAGGWALWLLAATQVPQSRGPGPVGDGLARGDWITIEALGLDSLGDGLPLWLLLALTVAFAVGVLGLRGGDRSGRIALPIGLALLALALWIASAVTAATAQAPRWLDLPVSVAEAKPVQPAQALSFEQGRWQRTALAGGACARADDTLRCTLPDGGEPLIFAGTSGAGGAVERDGLVWVRRGVQVDAEAASGRLELDGAISGQGRVGFDVGPERATIVPALRARVALVGTRRTGPIVIGKVGDAPTQLLASPGLASGPAAARLRAVHRVRLHGSSPWPGHLGALAAVAALAAAVSSAFAASRRGAPSSSPSSGAAAGSDPEVAA